MSKKQLFIFVFVVGIALLLRASPGKDFGTIKGVVHDEQGKGIPEALVSIKNLKTSFEYKELTDQEGGFVVVRLPFGVYSVKVEKEGFRSAMREVSLSKDNDVVTVKVRLDRIKPEGELEKKIALEEARGVTASLARRPELLPPVGAQPQFNTEEFGRIYENIFLDTLSNPLSTFSIDVDTASYSIVRHFIQNNQFPIKDAVRVEEMINYFHYAYPLPKQKYSFSIYTEMSSCPWNPEHRLLHIGLQGKKLAAEQLPPSNLVFLLDVSGSMKTPNKLPLLQKAFKLLVKELGEDDRVAIVVYAGAAGLVLPSTRREQKEKIIEAIEGLHAGGSTAGGAGIKLAYQVAEENFIKGGNNRVILATDGDFNVGISSTSELVRMIEEKRDKGIFLTILGFGMGNYKDWRMEQMADKGNGNYYYIDNLLEAKKVFMDDVKGTLFTIAKDVKIQIEFNPAKVKAYRLIGYENRLLRKEDFADDRKDAGELGAGHTVTALYELVPYGSKEGFPKKDSLKYQESKIKTEAFQSKEALTIQVRYKEPEGETSQLMVQSLVDRALDFEKASVDFKFSAAVAEFGMLLRDSEHKGDTTYEGILKLAEKGKGEDRFGYRAEFIRLVEKCRLMTYIEEK